MVRIRTSHFCSSRRPQGQQAMREKNPRVYAVLLAAQARLLQIWSGFNYLGYRDDYVPPWRFQYLLDRSRYYSEHAKNAQRDYLNFLSNAENEELKELSAAQNVELEKANIQIETARVEQASKEVTAAKQSADLASLNAKDANQKLEDYKDFDSESFPRRRLDFFLDCWRYCLGGSHRRRDGSCFSCGDRVRCRRSLSWFRRHIGGP